MKTLRNPYFLIALGLYLAIKALQKTGIHIPLVHDWVSDILCLPVILTVILAFQRSITFRNPGYTLRVWHIAFTVAYASLLFEVLLPRWSARYTADPWDVVAYLAGGILFYLLINKPARDSAHKLAS